MPLPDLPTDIEFTDAAGLEPSDHMGFHDELHQAYNAPFAQLEPERTGNYTLALHDANDATVVNAAGAVTITIPADATTDFPVGVVIGVYRKGAGTVSITPAGGVDLESTPDTLGTRSIAGRYGMVVLWKRFANKWVVFGDLA